MKYNIIYSLTCTGLLGNYNFLFSIFKFFFECIPEICFEHSRYCWEDHVAYFLNVQVIWCYGHEIIQPRSRVVQSRNFSVAFCQSCASDFRKSMEDLMKPFVPAHNFFSTNPLDHPYTACAIFLRKMSTSRGCDVNIYFSFKKRF